MDPFTLAMLVGGVGSLAGGVGNYFSQMDANQKAQAMQNEELQKWIALHIPDAKMQKVALQKLVMQGQLTPELENAVKQQQTELNNVHTDQGLKESQLRGLKSLESLGEQGGLNLSDKAVLQDIQTKLANEQKSKTEGVLADMAQRGAGNSGMSLQARLAANQAGSDQANRNALSVAAQAQARALQAIEGAGSQATQMRTQDYNEQAQRAAAQDAINRFNTANLQDVNARNAAIKNRDQEAMWRMANDINSKNAGIANDQTMYNSSVDFKNAQQQYQNEMDKLKGQQGVTNNLAGLTSQAGQTQGNLWSNIGSGVSGVAGAYGNKVASDDFWDNYFKKKQNSENQA